MENKFEQDFKKFFEEKQKVEQDNFCPTCGRRLWPTPHGPEPCHPWDYQRLPKYVPEYPYQGPYWKETTITCGRKTPGVYEYENGMFEAVD